MNIAHWEAEHVRLYGRNESLFAGERYWTNAELYDQACRLAGAFIRLGLKPGDRVAIALPNRRELFVASSAAWIAGGVVVVLEPVLGEVASLIAHCEPVVLVTLPSIAAGLSGSGKAPRIVSVDIGLGSPPLLSSFDELVAGGEPCLEPVPRVASDAAQLAYTSGATGKPKAVIYTHGGIDTFWRARVAGRIGRPFTSIVLLATPPTAFAARFIGMRVIADTKYVALGRFVPSEVLAAIERFKVTEMPLVPSMAEQLVAHRSPRRYDCSSLQVVNITGSHVSTRLVNELKVALTGNAMPCGSHADGSYSTPGGEIPSSLAVSVHYGMTETGGGFAATATGGDGVVGLVSPGAEVKIVDALGKEVDRGAIGEIVVRTPYAAVGYWRDAAASADVFQDGYVHSGDLGRFNAANELCVVGRAKDLIIQGGQNIHPAEIASVVREIEGVADCAVVGVEDALLGEVAVACVVLGNGARVSERAIWAHCRDRMSRRKQPGRVIFIDELPLTATGKVHAARLRDRIRAQAEPRDFDLTARLDANPRDRATLLRAALKTALCRILSDDSTSTPTAEVAPDLTFGELGVDSIGAVQLAHIMSGQLGRRLSPTLVYSFPTIDALSEHLHQTWDERGTTLRSAPTCPTRTVAAEEIAVVGIGCRLPGGVRGPKDLWGLLERGGDATSEAPSHRRPENGQAWRAGFIADIEQFDAHFFRLTAEAADLDPRHRMLLEVAWEAFEDAGQNPLALSSTRTGVFFGIYGERYATSNYLGAAPGMAVSRLCHFLDLQGPVLTIDTTCSSSLVALHSAVESLRSGECDLALVGGANLLTPHAARNALGVVSKGGRSRAFDGGADGFGQGEGCVLVVLKRSADAASDSDRVYATIRGTAINHDGRCSSLTAPNARAQAEVIRLALRRANVHADAVQYVEAHGTGTLLGDPIEVAGLTSVFGRREGPELVIGSAKTNFGHLEAAAGVAGVAKAALAIFHRRIPASLHFLSPNPHIPWSEIPIKVQIACTPWPKPEAPLIAGVSSFGMSGTNAHAVICEAPALRTERELPTGTLSGRACSVLPLSAKTPAALRTHAERCAAAIESRTGGDELDIGYTAGCRRPHLRHRLVAIGATRAEFAASLRAYVEGAGGVINGEASSPRDELVMVFTGQGPQWWGMTHRLMREEPVFARAVEEFAEHVDANVDWRLLEELGRDEAATRLARTEVAQPALVALQIGLYRLWKSWGVEPAAVAGHSLGEVAAAFAAGALSLQAAARLACERGRIMQKAAGRGAMLYAAISVDEACALGDDLSPEIEIAATNGPSSVTLTGERTAVLRAFERLQARGLGAKLLPVDCAFHSRQFEGLASELANALGDWLITRPAIPMFSTLTGDTVEALDATYWARQMRERVKFFEVTTALLDSGHATFVEVGPHPVVAPAIDETARQHTAGPNAVAIACQRRDAPGRRTMLEALARLYCVGYSPDWSRHYPARRPVWPLPTYPWQHQRHWHAEDRKAPAAVTAPQGEDVAAPATGQSGGDAESTDVNRYLYEIEWCAAALPARRSVHGTWLLFEDRGGVGEALRRELEERGARVLSVAAGEHYRVRGEGRFEIAIDDPVSIRRLLDHLAGFAPPRHIVHLSSVDVDDSECPTPAMLDEACRLGVVSVLHLVQALLATAWSTLPRLLLVTRGAQPPGDVRGFAQASLWGFGLSVAREYPNVGIKLIDLEPEQKTTGALCSELSAVDDETRVALRGEDRFVARLRRYRAADPLPASAPPRLSKDDCELDAAIVRESFADGLVRADRTYVVTGGFGFLGLVVARHLSGCGARHIVLIGRRRPSERARAEIGQLAVRGCDIRSETVPVDDFGSMARLLRDVAARLPPVAGVVHCAGTIRDATVANLDEGSLLEVMNAKVRGAWNLHKLTNDLDFFVLFSSTAGVLGSAGQANYAAANAFLDSLAHYRARRGLPAHSIDWGAWSAGMGSTSRSSRCDTIDAAQGASIFGWVIRNPVAQVLAYNGTVRLLGDDRSNRSLLSGLVDAGTAEPSADVGVGGDDRRDRAAPFPDRLRAWLAELAETSPDRIGLDDTFASLGIDSLATLRLEARLNDQLGLALPANALGPDSTARQLAARIGGRSQVGKPPRSTASSRSVLWLRAEGRDPPFVFVHPVGGGVQCYQAIADALPYRSAAIEAPGLRHPGDDDGLATVEHMAERYLDLLASADVRRPFISAGWSFGGLVAFEMAVLLRSRGLQAPLVALIDAVPSDGDRTTGALLLRTLLRAPEAPLADTGDTSQRRPDDPNAGGLTDLDMLRHFVANLATERQAFSQDRRRRWERYLGDLACGSSPFSVAEAIGEASHLRLLADVPTAVATKMFLVFRSNMIAGNRYRPPSTYDGLVLSISALRSPLRANSKWAELVPNLRAETLDADHYSIMGQPTVERLAALLVSGLERAPH